MKCCIVSPWRPPPPPLLLHPGAVALMMGRHFQAQYAWAPVPSISQAPPHCSPRVSHSRWQRRWPPPFAPLGWAAAKWGGGRIHATANGAEPAKKQMPHLMKPSEEELIWWSQWPRWGCARALLFFSFHTGLPNFCQLGQHSEKMKSCKGQLDFSTLIY